MSPATAEGGARGGIAAARGILAALVGPLPKMIQTCGLLSVNTGRNLGVSGLSDTHTLLASEKVLTSSYGLCGKAVEKVEGIGVLSFQF